MSSLNKVTLIGNLGADPEMRAMQNGKPVCNMRIATSESWRDKSSGEKRERTEWHKVVIFSEGLCKIAEQYLKKGSKVYIEGQLQTRKWEKDGQDHYSTEIVMQGFKAVLVMLDTRSSGDRPPPQQSAPEQSAPQEGASAAGGNFGKDLEDEIPFIYNSL